MRTRRHCCCATWPSSPSTSPSLLPLKHLTPVHTCGASSTVTTPVASRSSSALRRVSRTFAHSFPRLSRFATSSQLALSSNSPALPHPGLTLFCTRWSRLRWPLACAPCSAASRSVTLSVAMCQQHSAHSQCPFLPFLFPLAGRFHDEVLHPCHQDGPQWHSAMDSRNRTRLNCRRSTLPPGHLHAPALRCPYYRMEYIAMGNIHALLFL